ncbi:MAG: leishmanolysin-related zinc metalloendopeptidase [Gemmatimonadaceae bacterium]
MTRIARRARRCAAAALSLAAVAACRDSGTGPAGVPASLVVLDGGEQATAAGRTLDAPVRFAVRDRLGNGVAGVAVAMKASGGGTLEGATAGVVTRTTGADGTVAAPAWTLARSVVPQSVVATAGARLAATATATVRTSFDIDVRFVGSATPAQQAAFTAAAARLRGIIVGDQPPVTVESVLDISDFCGVRGLPNFTGTIDDIVIYAQVAPIDGVGRILAQAGPCVVRDETSGRLPLVGIMAFDAADVAALAAKGALVDVVLHEMIHVLGFSAGFFNYFGIATALGTTDPAFTGANGWRSCRDAGGEVACAGGVPIENVGGAGTAGSHWRETTFQSELMTGYMTGTVRPLSAITVGAFRDLGYEVNYDARDTYVLGAALSGGSLPAVAGDEWERVIAPRVVVSRDGTRRRLLETP